MPFRIVRNDITKMRVDAIVNTANPFPIYADGSDTAVYEAAGAEQLLNERKKIGVMKIGQAAITPAFALDAEYIIHTVGPVYWNGNEGEAELLYSCYENSLLLAAEKECESIAFPLISTGTYGYPKDEAIQIALAAINKFLTKEDMLVYLVVFDEESFSVSKKLFSDIDAYIDQNYVQEALEYEYFFDGIPVPDMAANCPDFSEKIPPAFGMPVPKKGAKKLEKAAAQCMPGVNEAFVQYEGTRSPKIKETFIYKADSRSLNDVMAELSETFQERLLRLIDEKGFSDVEIYKKANLSRKLFSKIRCNPDYRPKKMTAIALAIALELNLDQTIDLLGRAEMALSPSSKFDVIIKYFIEREIYDIYTINLALFEHEQPILGE